MKIITVVGARPQFIKAAQISRAIHASEHTEFLVHTGQHYDDEMSAVFFEELEIPEPNINLGIGSASHGLQTGRMLIQIEEILLAEKPDWIVIYGDTNSTLAAALAACKLNVPVAHVEAGLRSFNRIMPEEHNRVVSDHLSKLLLCPTQTAVKNLADEGIVKGVHLVGDVMYDSVTHYSEMAEKKSDMLRNLDAASKEFILATVHRAENTDNHQNLKSIFRALSEIAENGYTVIAPLHPRTRKQINNTGISINNIKIIEPVSYLEMLLLEKHARFILTDSGGVQKEAYWLKVPCLTLRNETEWIETVDTGWNIIVGADTENIVHNLSHFQTPEQHPQLYGDGNAALKCISLIASH